MITFGWNSITSRKCIPPAVLSIKTSLKAAVSADIVDGKNLETLNTISLCRAPILRMSQNEIDRKSCERKSAQSKTAQSGADTKDMVARAMFQLQIHETCRVVENAVCRLHRPYM